MRWRIVPFRIRTDHNFISCQTPVIITFNLDFHRKSDLRTLYAAGESNYERTGVHNARQTAH